ncbi:MAG TPA: MotA/TolQ/ExbB proton channel family protein [Chitinophagales bacterium]|nr:MotA/TolQ/ExbB proton channel family protein [Chitinophagales bacterium]
MLTINKAKGTGDLDGFLRNIKSKLVSNDINGALADCAKQQGSVANVVQAGLHKYAEMEKNTGLDAEQKVMNIQKEIEETTGLELPVLEKNMWILATIASVGTLIALFGTVLGMIKAFTGLAASGSPDPEVLATGISEALINTAIGIITSAVAIIFYNLCTNMIDKLTYGIDEMGYSISQTFAAKNK